MSNIRWAWMMGLMKLLELREGRKEKRKEWKRLRSEIGGLEESLEGAHR